MTTGMLDFDALVGAWTLRSAVATDATGQTSYPFGEEPAGVLLYTPDRWVSATITSSPGPAPARTCFYAGPVVVTGTLLEHRVAVGQAPFGPGTVQVRAARLVDGELELMAQSAGRAAVTTRLRWQRPSR